jgi:HEAT repeat protein
MLISIFAELPRLDDAAIVEHLLPVALAWSDHPDPDRRKRIAAVLSRMSNTSAQEALRRLQADPHPLVRTSATRAAESRV